MKKLNKRKRKPIRLLRGDQIKPEKIDWLWFPYIARGETTILSADPGSGKTMIALLIAAYVSNGLDFPINNRLSKKGNNLVIYLSREDTAERVLVPRFIACGGNIKNLRVPKAEDMPDTFQDERLEDIFALKPDLIVFDAVSSFFGDSNMNQANEVRLALKPLLDKARAYNTAVLLIAHNNKMSSVSNAQYRVSGSIDFTAFCRSGLTASKVLDETSFNGEEQFILAQFKNNLAPIGESLVFEPIISEDEETIGLKYTGTSDLDANALIGIANNGHHGTKQNSAIRIIQEALDKNGGLIRSSELDAILKQNDISASTGHRAKKALKLEHTTNYDSKIGKKYTVVHYSDVNVKVQESFLNNK